MKPPVILLIVIDSLRADRMSCYGYRLKTTPFLDSMLSDFVKFEWAFSPCSYTLPSMVSILTGKYPSEHSLGLYQTTSLYSKKLDRNKDITIAEVLKLFGYKTFAIFGAAVLNNRLGIAAGFDKVYESNFRRPYYETTDIVTSLIKKEQKPLFIFVHYFDVHSPYIYGCERNFFSDENYKKVNLRKSIFVKPSTIHPSVLINNRVNSNFYESCYDSSIVIIDEQIKTIIGTLKMNNLYNDLLIVITADHGELIGEDNIYFRHGINLHYALIRVPFLMKFPYEFKPTTNLISAPFSTRKVYDIIKNMRYTLSNTGDKKASKENFIETIQEKTILAEHPFQKAQIYGRNGAIEILLYLLEKPELYAKAMKKFLYSGVFKYDLINDRWIFVPSSLFFKKHTSDKEVIYISDIQNVAVSITYLFIKYILSSKFFFGRGVKTLLLYTYKLILNIMNKLF